MEITTAGSFVRYFERIRSRTLRVIACIPRDKIDWTHQAGVIESRSDRTTPLQAGKFSFADLIRHLGATERYMFAENARHQPSRYPGHGRELADGYDAVIQYLNTCHAESIDIFVKLSDKDLQSKCDTPAAVPITVWKWLRAMIEHEIHHRGQIYMMLGMLGVQTPPLYGLTAEEVFDRSRGKGV